MYISVFRMLKWPLKLKKKKDIEGIIEKLLVATISLLLPLFYIGHFRKVH